MTKKFYFLRSQFERIYKNSSEILILMFWEMTNVKVLGISKINTEATSQKKKFVNCLDTSKWTESNGKGY